LFEPPEDPQLQDKIRDVKLFGVLGLVPQFLLKQADIVSVWLSEDSMKPDYFTVVLELRDIKDKTEFFETIYTVSWLNGNNYFLTGVHMLPSGVEEFYLGLSNDGNSIIDSYIDCKGSYDFESNTITWIVSKDAVGGLEPGELLYDIHSSALLRFSYESELPMIDLFKDLSNNAKTNRDYIIRY